jgi:hypothetical protein
MSCENSSYCSAIVDVVPYSNPAIELGDFAAPAPTGLGRESREQGRPGLVAHRSRSLPDSTQIDPEYVWGDEGPIND